MKPAKLVLLADTLVALYEQMLRIRRCEERLIKSFHEGLIPGPLHSSLGQEAVSVGVCHHLRNDDAVFGTHRSQGHALAKGMPMLPLMAELYGRDLGCCGGHAGPSFLFDPDHGLLGADAISGSSIQQAVGAATAFQSLDVDRVAVAFLGDGAAMSGVFFECAQLAVTWQLPVVFICERNQFIGRQRSGGAGGIAPGAAAKYFDIPGYEVDGNDVTMVYAAAFEGVRRARDGKGPMIVECATHRHRPYSESDTIAPSSHADPHDAKQLHDPLTMLADRLVDQGVINSPELAELDKRVRAEVDESHRKAAESRWPAPNDADEGLLGVNHA